MNDDERTHEARMAVAINDVICVTERDKSYGSSWKKRGGVGAFMMLARKWDRIENLLKQDTVMPGVGSATQYDLFEYMNLNPAGILDDIRDLRRYLLLAESEMLLRGQVVLEHMNTMKVDETKHDFAHLGAVGQALIKSHSYGPTGGTALVDLDLLERLETALGDCGLIKEEAHPPSYSTVTVENGA